MANNLCVDQDMSKEDSQVLSNDASGRVGDLLWERADGKICQNSMPGSYSYCPLEISINVLLQQDVVFWSTYFVHINLVMMSLNHSHIRYFFSRPCFNKG